MTKENGYRRGVGVMLLNREGKVFVGARIDNTDEAWQMRQGGICHARSEEHTSELQSLTNLVCRPGLEKKPGRVTQSSSLTRHPPSGNVSPYTTLFRSPC